MSAISQLLARRGDIEADRQRQNGQIWGQTISALGNVPASIVQMRQGMQEAEQGRKVADARLKTEGIQQQVGQGQLDAQKASREQDAAIRQLFLAGTPTPEAILAAAGPERGGKIVEGMAAFEELSTKRVTDARSTAGRLASGMKALMPDLRARLSPAVRKAAIDGGLGDEQSLPAVFDDKFLDGVIQWSLTPAERMAGEHNAALQKNAEATLAVTSARDAAARTDREADNKRAEAGAAEAARHNRALEAKASPPESIQLVGPKGEQTIAQGVAAANALMAQGWKKYDATAVRQDAAPQNAKAVETAKEVQRIAQSLRDHEGFGGAFGVVSSKLPTMRQGTADAEVLRDTLTSLLTLENMGVMKGVLSDSDMKIIRQASSSISPKMSEAAARAELNRLGKVMSKITGEAWADTAAPDASRVNPFLVKAAR